MPESLKKLVKQGGTLVAPSVLSADFSRLADEIADAKKAGADMIHLDVMDGSFVPNITIGPVVVQKIRAVTDLPLDVHLMISNPDQYIDEFIKAGADTLAVHVEACTHLHRTVQHIRESSVRFDREKTSRVFDSVAAGVALNPHTPVCSIENILHDLDFVLVMTVNPGFGGQKFIESCVPKIAGLRKLIDGCRREIAVEVDGGVNPETSVMAREAGAVILVAGAAVFSKSDYREAIQAVRG